MKLLFHIGLNKSGSSFLQGLFDYNRALLYDNNISYPYSYSRQYSTNGTDIAFALKDLDRQRLINVLRKYSQNADGKDILISSEFIYHQVIKEKQRGLLFVCIEECGLAFSKPSLITVFRNVFSHSVSAFCHRAGVHPLPQVDEWLKSKGTHSHLNYNYYEFF